MSRRSEDWPGWAYRPKSTRVRSGSLPGPWAWSWRSRRLSPLSCPPRTVTRSSCSARGIAISISAGHNAKIVPLFEVDDLDEARAEIASGGAEVLGEPESDDVWTWLNFRGPDGNVCSLGARPA